MSSAIFQIVVADISMSLDNVLAVAGAAMHHPVALYLGLGLAVVLMGGIYSIWGAILAALFLRLLPPLLDDWGVSTELLTILFGVGVLQVLLTAPGGLIDQVPRDLAKLRRALGRLYLKWSGKGSAA